jgi:transcriptional regulator of acetoin/glycerol metabolism
MLEKTKACHGGNLQLRFHPLVEGIGTLAEGVAALSEDGYVIGANRAGLGIFGLRPADLGAVHLERLLHIRLTDLLDWTYKRGSEPIPLQLATGSQLFVRVEAGRVVRPVAALSISRKVDALSALNTGCGLIRTAIDKVRKVLDKPIPVLLQGESGVGKEVFAQAMHASGPRRDQTFVAVDCSSLPENLIEAELFGYGPGAFTGARRNGSPGRIREADGGTLFLDEIGDMPLTMQSRLLRVLQERQVTPLGGGKAVAVDFALICATHRNLKVEMESSRFRADLYYRLNGLTLMLPALRNRTDFQALLNRLLEEMAPSRRVALDASVAAALAGFSWPGNIRQLVNVMRTACALLDEGEARIGWSHLPDDLVDELRKPFPQPMPHTIAAPENLHVLSEAAITRAVAHSCGNMSEAARRLGISRNTLYRRIKKEGLI